MKTRVINILPHKPDYDYLKDKPRPAINWDTPAGDWVGIYRNEIPDKLGEEILKYSDEFEFEVWQPDYRADKMYAHRFDDGLVHRLFPAEDVKKLHGFKVRKEISSAALLRFLHQYARDHKVIINLNGDFCQMNFEVLEEFGHLPILQTFRGVLNLPGNLIFKPRINFPASLSYFRQHLKVKSLIRRIDYIMVQNEFFNDDLKAIYSGPIEKLTSGCEFDVWQPMERQEARKALNLPLGRKIFFTSSLLIPIKQLDKLIKILNELGLSHDFLLLISGHGVPEYEDYLKKEASALLSQDKLRFVGYLHGEELRQHYCASNLFVHPSISEGGPVAAMKALACGTPVMISKVSNVAERLLEAGVGKVVEPFNYVQWKNILSLILEGEEVKPFPRERAKEIYDWQAVAKRFVEIFRELEKKVPLLEAEGREMWVEK